MKSYVYINLIFCFFLAASVAVGQVKFVNEFLNIGVGARAHGMFGSVVASGQDASSAYWNPAGLTGIDAPMQVSVMHASWFGGIANYDHGTIAKRLDNGRSFAALTYIRMGVDQIPNTINLIRPDGTVDFDNVTEFSAADYAVMGSYARILDAAGRFSVGGNIKVIRRVLGEFGGAWGFGADLGVRYERGGLTLAVMARDITTTFNAWSFNLKEEEKEVFAATGNEIPISSTEIALPRVILAAAYKVDLKKFTALAEVNLNINTDGRQSAVLSSDRIAVDPSVGIELGYRDLVFLRGGIGNIQRVINSAAATDRSLEMQPNLGLGVTLGRLSIDYALTNIGSVSGVLVSNIFSVSLNLAERQPKDSNGS